ncbi:AraC family transcriptional regulator [Aquitalea sp. LB_tupeE]|uniref:AraC family transcriptional regulator n=1 Tax=Aquitalea sp. LB_tupeE TaxID=2748078 RepID=UPI0015B9EB4C|nr:AraC family transcriptional regulator [Aquitalea sp. LB_tupeE]NWK80398.1 AraC family transcriptional regulator [Aquitalea sp. LB_tupeE]
MPVEERSGQRQEQSQRTMHERMAEVIQRWTAGKEVCETAIPNLGLFRREAATEPCSCFIGPSIVLVAQGAKQLLIGEHAYTYNTDRFLVTSLDLPASSQILEASPEKPCLGLVLELDLRVMAEFIAQSGLPPPRNRPSDSSAALGKITPAILEPFGRLLALLDEPGAISALAPLIEREIHYRLLMSDQAARLWQIASVGSQSHRIARAVDWLKKNYALPLRINELADYVQMSATTLHHHFRQLTAMSPLQYQKWLRLHEARRLMLNERLDVSSAAFQVGYESPSQFNREYSRLFGNSPKRDVDELRRHATLANSFTSLEFR